MTRAGSLLIAAIFVAACGVSPQASAPAATGSAVLPTEKPTPRPRRTLEPEPTPDPCPLPEELLANDSINLVAGPGYDVFLELDVTSIARRDDPTGTYSPPTRETYRRAWFLGGRESSMSLDYGSLAFDGPAGITSVRVVLTPDGQDPVELPARLEQMDGTVAAIVTPPDVSVVGRLDVELEWTDPCFRMTATASSDVRISAAATVEGCPDRDRAAHEEVEETFRPPLRIGGIEVDLTARPFGKVHSITVIDATHPLSFFRADTPTITAVPGQRLVVASDNRAVDLDVTDLGRGSFYPRAPWIRWVEAGGLHSGDERPNVAFSGAFMERLNGDFVLTVPDERGRYAAGISFEYDAACSFGDAGAAFGVDVE